jgi:peptide deformylase
VAVRPVRIYPDPILKRVAEPVAAIDDDALALAEDLVDTMRAHERCVGLAANQIGVLRRCIVVDVTDHPKAVSAAGLVVLFDPVIASASGRVVGRKGCLSIPDLTANVARAEEVVVSGLEPSGSSREVRAHGFEARAFQHEIDHLDGILFLDRVASLETDVFRRRA